MRGRRGRWSLCASAGGPCWCSGTRAASRSTAFWVAHGGRKVPAPRRRYVGRARPVHQRGLIHKDIKPTNFIVNSATGQVWLTGFGIASRLPRERQAPEPPEFIAGTLAYMAPEQTGRMNCSIDSRSDLYALGVTFYEMLTGSLPFTASDRDGMGALPHREQPVPPGERVERYPCAGIGDRLEAPRQDRRGTLSDGRGSGARPAALPAPNGSSRQSIGPRSPLGRARYAGPALDPGEAVRTRGRDRYLARLLRPSREPAARRSWCSSPAIRVLANPPSSTSCTRRLFRHAACSHQASSTSTSATFPMQPWRKPFRRLVRPILGKSEAELARWRRRPSSRR